MSSFKTPLRYPGGKQRLTPFIIELLSENEIYEHYAEPYAGGAGVAIELLLNKFVNKIHLNDSSIGIYAFWYAILNYPEQFCRLISSSSLTVEEWKKQRDIVKKGDLTDLLELGFSVFYLNRCNRSGVLSAGLIGGLAQTGNYKMDARFNRNDLIRRIESISLFSDKISISNFDAESYIENYLVHLPDNSLVYLDPPYFEKGSQLYLNSYKKNDHARIADIIQNRLRKKWILSYDGVKEILNLYCRRRHFLYDLQYNAAKVYKGKEVFVFGDDIILPKSSSLSHVQVGMNNIINGYDDILNKVFTT